MLKKINTNQSSDSNNPYSEAVAYKDLIFTSGQLPIDPATGNITGDNIETQATQVMKNISAFLKANSIDFEHVIKTTCFLVDMNDFATFNKIYSEYFIGKPARSCFCVKALPKGALCEVELVAALTK